MYDIYVPKDCLFLANSEDPDEMPPYAKVPNEKGLRASNFFSIWYFLVLLLS